MRLLAEVRERLRALLAGAREDREADEELRFHLEMQVEENLRRGMGAAEARRAALLSLGGALQVREAVRDARGLRWLEEVTQDARYALRVLRRSPGFTLVAVLTLALGIGANSALFGLLDALWNRVPPGMRESDRLVWVHKPGPFQDASYPDYLDLREQAAGTVDIAAYLDANLALGSGGEPVRVSGMLVSDNYFQVLGAVPAAGRAFLPEENRAPGAAAVAVLAHELWQRRFSGDPGIVGRTIVLNGHDFTVVGVAAEGFVGTDFEHPAELWVPIAMQPVALPVRHGMLDQRRSPDFHLVGRLADGVPIERAQAVVSAIAARLDPLAPQRFRPLSLELHRLRGWAPPGALGGMLPQVAFAWALTALVLLVACANVANLLLARAVTRRREIGIRLAIGAGRGRLVRQLLAESLLLALGAGAVGTLIAFWGASWFQARFRGPFAPLDVTPDATTLAFAFCVALATGVLFGLVPAWRASRPHVMPALAGDGGGVFRRSRLQGALVAVQVALSVALLFTGGLFVRKLQALAEVDVGYDAANVLAASFDLYAQQYGDEAMASFYQELRERVARLPGVVAASVPAYAPLGGGALLSGVQPAPGEESPPDGASGMVAIHVGVAPDYFRTLGVPLLRGRDFAPEDFAAGASAVIVSESFARRLSPGRDPIGRRFRLWGDGPALEVVGVARDVAASSLVEENRAIVFVPYTRHLTAVGRGVTLLVRTAGPPAAVLPALRHEVRQMDAALPLFDVQTLADLVDRELGLQRRAAALVSCFGLLALLLAALGLYGIIAYAVAGRTREIGLRIALGAPDRDVVGLFVRDGLRLTAAGLTAGGLLALALGRLVASAVTGVRPLDPAAALGVVATLGLAAVLASYLPARRAARVDPMQALRVE